MTQQKHLRMRKEYNGQCERLFKNEQRFRKVGRKQIEERALRRQGCEPIPIQGLTQSGIKSLHMTPELCGLLRKINNTRKMLYMPETTSYKLLR